MLTDNNRSLEGSTVVISGSGNVAIYAAEKAVQLGAKVVTMSDSNGYIYDADGINLDTVKLIKEVNRGRISEYINSHPKAEYFPGCNGIWSIPCDIALPCATQNELDSEGARLLIKNGCMAVGEGANMPTTSEAIEILKTGNVLFAPAKAANAGGVATSALEMSQNSIRLSWSFEEVDMKLKEIMVSIYKNISDTAKEYGCDGDLIAGANIAGFIKVADAMLAQGIV
jgi:glutamate dehydrogenase (NADP+)